jgi:hypothetical protein
MKKCKKCEFEKELLEFEVGRSQCKECRKKNRQERRKNNINTEREKRKEIYQKNKELEKEKRREYYKNNKEKEKEYQINYFKKHPEKVRETQRKWNKKNPNLKKDRDRRYYEKNKSELQKKNNEYIKNRKKKCPLFKLVTLIRSRIYQSINNKGYKKNSKTEKILGCTFEEFKLFIELKFEDWMNWDNYGLYNGEINHGWDLDHILPISSAKTNEEVIILNHHSNFQPLCSKINRDIKRNILTH